MGWLFKPGSTRRELVAERVEGWQRTLDNGVIVNSACLAHCYRGNVFSGVLWSVWERTFDQSRRQRPIPHPALDSMRPAAVQPLRRRLGIQGHGRVHAPVLLLMPAQVSGHGAARRIRRQRGMAEDCGGASREAEGEARCKIAASSGSPLPDDEHRPAIRSSDGGAFSCHHIPQS